LNAVYFLRTVVYLYIPIEKVREESEDIERTGADSINNSEKKYKEEKKEIEGHSENDKMLLLPGMHCPWYVFGVSALVILNFVLGLCSSPIIDMIRKGLGVFE